MERGGDEKLQCPSEKCFDASKTQCSDRTRDPLVEVLRQALASHQASKTVEVLHVQAQFIDGVTPVAIQEHFPVPRIQKTDEELRVHFISKVVDVLVMMYRRVSAVPEWRRQSSISSGLFSGAAKRGSSNAGRSESPRSFADFP